MRIFLFVFCSLACAWLRAEEAEPQIIAVTDQEEAPAADDKADKVVEKNDGESKRWADVEKKAARSAEEGKRAIEEYFSDYPHGRYRAQAYYLRGRLESNLSKSLGDFKKAVALAGHSGDAAKMSLELAEAQYALGQYPAALQSLEKISATEKEENEVSYWKGQTYLMLKDYNRAREMFTDLLKKPEDNRWTPLARLGAADCDLSLGDTASAYAGYKLLWAKDSPLAAQALWQGAHIQEKLGNTLSAKILYEELARAYHGTFEAGRSAQELADLESRTLNAATQKNESVVKPAIRASRPGVYTIQVAAYSQSKGAEELSQKLERKKYQVSVRRQMIDVSPYYEVCIGRYASKKEAQEAGKKISKQEDLPYVIKALP